MRPLAAVCKWTLTRFRTMLGRSAAHRAVWICAILVFVPLLIYWRWLNFHVFSYGDWNFRFVANLKEYLHVSTWTSGIDFGSFNDTIWRAPLDLLFGLFALAGWGMNVSEKFIVFVPMALMSMIAPYLLLMELFKNRKAALLGALFYATNTYFLAINPQGQQLLTLAGNVATFFLVVFLKALRGRRTDYFVGAALLLWAAGVIDFRLFYIGAFVVVTLLLYRRFVSEPGVKLPGRQLLLFSGIVILSEISWIVTFAKAQSLGTSTTLDNSLFGDKFWNLPSALALHHPFWNGVTTTWFVVNQVPFYFWFAPLAAFSGVLLLRKNKHVAYFACVAVVGALLSKQVSQPFGGLYPFLYAHVPGFDAFRESTKFYYLIALGYTVLIAGLFVALGDQSGKPARPSVRFAWQRWYWGLAGALVLFCAGNAWPYISGSMQKLLAARTIPHDYTAVANFDVYGDRAAYYRTLWVPAAPRWSYFTSNRPRVGASALTGLPQADTADGQLPNAPAEQIDAMIRSPLFRKYLDAGAIKYVMVPSRDDANQDDIFPQYGNDRQFFIDELDAVPFLRRVNIGTSEVVAYENVDAGSSAYIAASSWLIDIADAQNVASLYQFSAQNVAAEPDFAVAGTANNRKTTVPITSISQPFTSLSAGDVHNGGVTLNLKAPSSSTLYINVNRPHIDYRVNGGVLSLTATYGNAPSVNGAAVSGSPARTVTLSSTPIDPTEQYYLKLNGELVPINLRVPSGSFGAATDPPEIVASTRTNLVPNGSFEQGLWQPNVADCSPYANKPGISMDTDTTTKSDGRQSLKLMTTSHIACTDSAPFAVTPGTQYVLSFDYVAPYSNRISYGISFDNGPVRVMSKTLASGSLQWRTQRLLVTVPAGMHTMRIQLRGLPLATYNYGNQVLVTNYDDVAVNPVADDVPSGLNATPQYQKVPIASVNTAVTYQDSTVSALNLVTNGSFEQGLWQKTVDDCDPLDSRSPIIYMQRSVVSPGDRGKSLELGAQTHAACTGPAPVAVDANAAYVLSFDYQSPNAKAASYSLAFNDADRTVISGNLTASAAWQTFTRTVSVPLGATQMTLKAYARSNSSGSSVVDRYDNFKLLRVPDLADQMYLASTPPVMNQPRAVNFTNTSSTTKTVHINGAATPFYLTMSEAFDKGWQLRLAGGKPVGADDHVEANGFMNAWYVDPTALCKAVTTDACHKEPDGSYDLHFAITYTPQRWLDAGTMVSGVVVIGAAAYLLKKAYGRRAARQHRQPASRKKAGRA